MNGSRWRTNVTLIPHARVAEEIVRDRNVNVGLIAAVLIIGIPGMILLLL